MHNSEADAYDYVPHLIIYSCCLWLASAYGGVLLVTHRKNIFAFACINSLRDAAGRGNPSREREISFLSFVDKYFKRSL